MPHAVIVPASPALLPAVSGRTPDLEDVRTAAGGAVRHLLATGPGRVVVVADATHEADETSSLDLRGYGVTVDPAPSRPLPVGYASAAWLLDEAGWDGPRLYTRPGSIDLADGDGSVVVADGTACRSERAPGHLDERAEGVDDRLSSALASGDLRVLDELDETTVRELMIGGFPALGWLRAAAAHQAVSAELDYDGAPLGVGLWVARWSWGSPAR